MVKAYFNQVRRLLAVLVVCFVAANASATPFKNIHVLLEANESGRGVVYIRTEDPSNKQTRKGEKATLKATIGENGNDVSRAEGDSLRGMYMIWLYGEPEDGFELAGFSLVKKADGEYTFDDLLVSAKTDNGNFDSPYAPDKVDEGYEFVFNANCGRPEDAKSENADASDAAREEARSKNNWNENPDHHIYAVFVPEGTVLPGAESGGEGINDVKLNAKKGQAYTLSGMKATRGRKGIVIVDGHKIVR
jgi:hypothetical protein